MADDRADQPPMREAFALLGHDIRLKILEVLLDNWVAAYTDPIQYAELMDAVGVEDSGKFNYHLGKLRGGYVQKVDDGYVPTAAATALYRAVVAHQPTQEPNRTRLDVDSKCPHCNTALGRTHDRGFLSVVCDSCDEWAGFSYPFPKNGFTNRTDEEIVRATHRRCKHDLAIARSGQCPFCAATTAVEIKADAIREGNVPAVEIRCDAYSFYVGTDILFPLLLDTRVVAILTNAGITLDHYEWELPERTTAISSQSPLRIQVTVAGDEETATIVVDDRLNVCSAGTQR
jgi:phage FluMu protein Com